MHALSADITRYFHFDQRTTVTGTILKIRYSYLAKRMAGKNVSEMNYFVSSGT